MVANGIFALVCKNNSKGTMEGYFVGLTDYSKQQENKGKREQPGQKKIVPY